MTMGTERGERQKPNRTRSDYLRTLERARAETVPAMSAVRERSSAIPAPPSNAPRSGRSAIVVDEVGVAAVRLAARIPRDEVPRRTKAGRNAGAALGEADRALLALVDGKRTVGAIIERTGSTSARVGSGLCRLERLGLIAF